MSFYRKMRRDWRWFNVIVLIITLELLFPQHATAATEPVLTTEYVADIPGYSTVITANWATPTRITAPPAWPEIPNRLVLKRFRVTMTAYTSSVDETDSDPFTTASGAKTGDGVIAYNHLPFGSKVRFPEVYGDKVFTVLDRLNPKNGGPYHADIWMVTKHDARQWGRRVVVMEILK